METVTSSPSTTCRFLKEYPFLTRQEFDLAAKAFTQQSRHANDDEDVWDWVEHQKLKNFGYLCKKVIRCIVEETRTSKVGEAPPEAESQNNDSQIIEDSVVEEEHDPSVIDTSTSTSSTSAGIVNENSDNPHQGEEYVTVDYHIIYSPSYKVPALYFNAYHADGSVLTLDQLYTALVEPSRLNDLRIAGFNGGLSQQDHPTLLIPFYFLHPCETASLMRTVANITAFMDDDHPGKTTEPKSLAKTAIPLEGYMRSWLSLVGPVVGVKVTPGYFTDQASS